MHTHTQVQVSVSIVRVLVFFAVVASGNLFTCVHINIYIYVYMYLYIYINSWTPFLESGTTWKTLDYTGGPWSKNILWSKVALHVCQQGLRQRTRACHVTIQICSLKPLRQKTCATLSPSATQATKCWILHDIAWRFRIAAICCLRAVGHIVHNSTVKEDDSSTRRFR